MITVAQFREALDTIEKKFNEQGLQLKFGDFSKQAVICDSVNGDGYDGIRFAKKPLYYTGIGLGVFSERSVTITIEELKTILMLQEIQDELKKIHKAQLES